MSYAEFDDLLSSALVSGGAGGELIGEQEQYLRELLDIGAPALLENGDIPIEKITAEDRKFNVLWY